MSYWAWNPGLSSVTLTTRAYLLVRQTPQTPSPENVSPSDVLLMSNLRSPARDLFSTPAERCGKSYHLPLNLNKVFLITEGCSVLSCLVLVAQQAPPHLFGCCRPLLFMLLCSRLNFQGNQTFPGLSWDKESCLKCGTGHVGDCYRQLFIRHVCFQFFIHDS